MGPPMALHSRSTANSCPVDGASYSGIATTNTVDGGSYSLNAGSFPVLAGSYPVDVRSYPVDGVSYPINAGSFLVHAGSFPLQCRSRCPCIATSYSDAYPVHYPIDGKSTLHRRKIHHPSTALITPSTPLLYRPKRLATQTPHSHHRLPNFLLFFFFRIWSHQFPIRSSASTTISTAILTHLPSRSIALYIHHHLYTQSEQAIPASPPSLYLFISPSLSLSLSPHKNTLTHTLHLEK